MNVYIKALIYILIICVVMSGCSLTQFDSSIKEKINSSIDNDTYTEIAPTTSYYAEIITDTEVSEPINSDSNSASEVNKENIVKTNMGDYAVVKGVGDTFDAFIKLKENGEENIRGTANVTVTLSGIEIYDSFYDSPVELNSSILEEDGTLSEFSKNMIELSSFILVDLTFVYTAPEGEEKECVYNIDNEFMALWLDSKVDPKKNYPFPPYLKWFSDPNDGSDERLGDSKNSGRFILKDGESYNCQIGVFAAKQYIEDENVFLQINYLPDNYAEGFKHKYFALYPEE